MKPILKALFALTLLPGPALAATARGHLETDGLPAFLRDRGEGVSTSMFGTYVQKGQLLVYPFFEYYRDANFEYAPDEFNYTDGRDFHGDYEASEQLLMFVYGVSDRLAVELEGAFITAELEKSPNDPSGLPPELVETGIGDVEGQIRWRWSKETERRPELFSYFETVGPTQPDGSLIGTSGWEFKLGSGLTRGTPWGTVTLRAAGAYDGHENKFEMGEAAVEYLKRLSPRWRVYAGVEGAQDEYELITEAQWHVAPRMFVKLNSGFGLTPKATDWAPEAGFVFGF